MSPAHAAASASNPFIPHTRGDTTMGLAYAGCAQDAAWPFYEVGLFILCGEEDMSDFVWDNDRDGAIL